MTNNPSDGDTPAQEAPRLVVFDRRPTYAEWCAAIGIDPDNDRSREAFSEWRANS